MNAQEINWTECADADLERLWLHGETEEIQNAAHAERVARNQREAQRQMRDCTGKRMIDMC